MDPQPPRTGADVLRAAASRLALRATVGLVALVTLLVATHVLLERALHERSSDALTIELASNQRILVQRVASAARAVAADERESRELLVSALDELEVSHEQLFHGRRDLVDRPPTQRLERLLSGRSGLDAALHDFIAQARTVTDPDAGASAREYALARVTVAADGALDAPLAAHIDLERSRIEGEQARDRWLLRGFDALGVAAAVALVLLVLRPLAGELRVAAARLVHAEAEQERRQQWHREFAAIANHELRTPVTVIAGLARTLVQHRGTLPTELHDDIVDRIDRQGRVMTELLDELSTVAGLAGSTVDVEHVDLDDLTREVRGGRDGIVTTDCGLTLLVDRGRLRLLLRELVDNAIVHGSPPVVMSARASGADLHLEVRDHGPGIAPEDVRRLLQAFAVGNAADNHAVGDGRGLGLSMVSAIVTEAHGTLDYRREVLGGAWVVTLPGTVTADRGADVATARPAPTDEVLTTR